MPSTAEYTQSETSLSFLIDADATKWASRLHFIKGHALKHCVERREKKRVNSSVCLSYHTLLCKKNVILDFFEPTVTSGFLITQSSYAILWWTQWHAHAYTNMQMNQIPTHFTRHTLIFAVGVNQSHSSLTSDRLAVWATAEVRVTQVCNVLLQP